MTRCSPFAANLHNSECSGAASQHPVAVLTALFALHVVLNTIGPKLLPSCWVVWAAGQ